MTIGFMQGRLSPAVDQRIQFFPENWEQEFRQGKQLGFTCLEWLFDWYEYEQNPIFDPQSITRITTLMKQFSLTVPSICADYFMKYKLINPLSEKDYALFGRLIENARAIGVHSIVIPLLEDGAIHTETDRKNVVESLSKLLLYATAAQIHLLLESELSAKNLGVLLADIQSPYLGICYDVGNCTSYGYNCPSEIRHLGSAIREIHLKDRKVNSTQSVNLGTGDVDFFSCFRALNDIHYEGSFILQAWRGPSYLNDAAQQYVFVKTLYEKNK